MTGRTSPASRRTASPAAALRGPFKLFNRLRAFRFATTFWWARICAIAPALRHNRRPKRLVRRSVCGRLLYQPANSLTVAGRKRLELARALATEPKLLLLDEVLAGLNPSEINEIVPVIRALSARGIAIVMIEHVMQAVMSLAEHVFVLAEGRVIAQGSPAQVAADARVVEAYLGHGAAAKLGGASAL